MLSQLIQKLLKPADQVAFTTPADVDVEFNLSFRSLNIGSLTLHNGFWSFKYSQDFKEQNIIKPLPDFPDVNKVYDSSELYPFFAIRIPGSGQLKAKGYQHTKGQENTVELLKYFGQRSISNPFLLQIAK